MSEFTLSVLASMLATVFLFLMVKLITYLIRFDFGLPLYSSLPENRALSVTIKNPFPSWLCFVELVGHQVYHSINNEPTMININISRFIPHGSSSICLRKGTEKPMEDEELNFYRNPNAQMVLLIRFEFVISFLIVRKKYINSY